VIENETREARTEAVRALEAEFGELISRMRRVLADNAQRVSPGMLPGAYKVFTTIVRRESVTLSALADSLMADKGQISRTVRELEELGLITRTPDPADGRSSLLSPHPKGWNVSPPRGRRRRACCSTHSKSGRSMRSAT